VCEGQDAFSISVIYRTIYILIRSHKSATKTATQMGSGNEKLDFSAEHREFLPQQIGAVSHAYLFRNTSNQTPFVSSGFDAGNLPLFGFGKRLAV
jgi:hypothetical protein